ncbi:unnamed protein product [Caenorhabditis auriculariae]|uniref:Insulin-like domain-containing protein n=1 Tax=Caenorhabditis auriculariae TaxID=2777116 RepID=A0A8S1HC44_9PELO|nr:unnamed protein product [Caenorhabditis auriculariae]
MDEKLRNSSPVVGGASNELAHLLPTKLRLSSNRRRQSRTSSVSLPISRIQDAVLLPAAKPKSHFHCGDHFRTAVKHVCGKTVLLNGSDFATKCCNKGCSYNEIKEVCSASRK